MIKQKLIAKYAKKFAGKSEARPMLQGVHYGADATVTVTNSHIMLQIRTAHTLTAPTTLHAATGVPLEGEYPDVSRIVPQSFSEEIHISRAALDGVLLRARMAADVASRLNKKGPVVVLSTSNGVAHLQIKADDGRVDFQAFLGNTMGTEHSTRSLNAEYLHLGLSVLADAATDVVIKLKKSLDPIVLTGRDDPGHDIVVLILPYLVAAE